MAENYDVLEKIIPLFDSPEKYGEIEEYLSMNSNLPSPRGNLTLAFKFAECFEKSSISKDMMEKLIEWVNLSEEEAPVNHPKEFLPFCGILSLGAHYPFADDETRNHIMMQFKVAMNDRRWRTREGVAMGFQKIAEKDFNPIKKYFTLWYPDTNYLEKRAFVAALAHPPILKDEKVVRFSLIMSEDILKDILSYSSTELRTEEFKVLSKGLEYALSVFVTELPEEGFELLKKYAKLNNPILNKIIKVNLSKARLYKKYPEKVAEVISLIK